MLISPLLDDVSVGPLAWVGVGLAGLQVVTNACGLCHVIHEIASPLEGLVRTARRRADKNIIQEKVPERCRHKSRASKYMVTVRRRDCLPAGHGSCLTVKPLEAILIGILVKLQKAMHVIAMPTVLFWKPMMENVMPRMARTVFWQRDTAEKARIRVTSLASCARHVLTVLELGWVLRGERGDGLMMIAPSGHLLPGVEVPSK